MRWMTWQAKLLGPFAWPYLEQHNEEVARAAGCGHGLDGDDGEGLGARGAAPRRGRQQRAQALHPEAEPHLSNFSELNFEPLNY